jgi:hypothetical protein
MLSLMSPQSLKYCDPPDRLQTQISLYLEERAEDQEEIRTRSVSQAE